MCGIAGVVYDDGRPPGVATLEAMARQLWHRGPDGGGVHAFRGAGLAHRRLSILDLSEAAAQPMLAQDSRSAIVFNGEIYNFQDLRAELEHRGHVFRSSGDTEVALALYEHDGPDGLQRLDGMFALGIWDDARQRLVLARDRTGKKPLFVYEDREKLIFGSEIKAILAHPEVDRTMNPEALPQYLCHGYVPSPATFYSRVRRLPAAATEVITWQGGRRTSRGPRVFWDFPVAPTVAQDELRAERRTRELFFAAVKKRMVADVPLGAFLSGGVDSSLVVAAMALQSPSPVKTFTVGFAGHPTYDESRWARIVAKRWGTEHTELQMQPASFDQVEKLAWNFDEPFGASSAVPTFLLASLARDHVKVILNGDGGDDLYAGYERFLGASLAERLPSPARALLAAGGRLPRPEAFRSMTARIQRLAVQAGRPLPDRIRGWLCYFEGPELLRLLRGGGELASDDALGRSYRETLARAQGADPVNALLYLNARTYLLDDLNVKVDRASMAASLETRSPFLDTALIEHAFSLPGGFKLRGRTYKAVLKQSMRDLLPKEIIQRKKMGFGVPLGQWFRGELKGYLEERILASGSRIHEHLHRAEVERLFDRHAAGLQDYGQQFWVLLMLELWLRREEQARAQA